MSKLPMSTRFFLFSLCSAWMIAIGLRMIIEIILNHYTVYFANKFDLIFDWGMLLFLGVISLLINIYIEIKKSIEERKKIIDKVIKI